VSIEDELFSAMCTMYEIISSRLEEMAIVLLGTVNLGIWELEYRSERGRRIGLDD